jgi:hypothetical protein
MDASSLPVQRIRDNPQGIDQPSWKQGLTESGNFEITKEKNGYRCSGLVV